MMIDPICSAPSLDLTLFDQLTSPYFDVNKFKPFLCEIMKLAGQDNIDPILYSPEPFDYSSVVLDFTSLTGVGDPRYSLGYILSSNFAEFLPLAIAQLEVIRSGGCQIIDGYICDSDGNKKRDTITYCPPNFTMTPLDSQQISLRTLNVVEKSVDDYANRFCDYIKSLENDGWIPTLFYYTNFYTFYVKLTKQSGILYFKYYPDAKENVSKYLGIPITMRTDSAFDSQNHYNAMSIGQIPNYDALANNQIPNYDLISSNPEYYLQWVLSHP